MKSYTFHIHEMHCASCTVLTEMELTAHSNVESVRVHLDTKTVDVVGSFASHEEAQQELAAARERAAQKVALDELREVLQWAQEQKT